MSPVTLFYYLLKATFTSFSGLTSLPVLRQDLVLNLHVLTDQQLNSAVAISRMTPGPAGLYVVSVGYFVDGVPGAIAGWLAIALPSLLIIPLIHFMGGYVSHPRIRSMLQAVVLTSAGLLWASSIPLGRAAVYDPLTIAIFAGTILLLILRKWDSLWVILAATAVEIAAASVHLVSGL